MINMVKTLNAALYFNKEVITRLANISVISVALTLKLLKRTAKEATGWTNMDCDKDF